MENFKIEENSINEINILSIAYIGDSVWEVYVRNFIVKKYLNSKVNKHHKEAIKYVSAKGQSSIAKELLKNFSEGKSTILNDDLVSVLKRGRNASKNPTKNAKVQEYNYATGFEALIGYLYIKGEIEKINTIASEFLK